MKKIYFTLILTVISILPGFSQDSLKISEGKFSTELNINPLIGDLSFNNAIKQIKFRYFTSDHSALRIAFSLNNTNQQLNENNPYGQNSYSFTSHKKSTTTGLNLGYEKHFEGTRRLSPYVGFELSFVNKSSSHKTIINSNETLVKGAWNFQQQGQGFEERAYFSYGLNLLSGFDFYIAQNFYFGYEMGFGFNKIDYKDIEITHLYGTGTPFGNESSPRRDDKSFEFGPNLLNGIRLGFVF